MKKFVLVVALIGIVFFGCSVKPSKIERKEAQSMAENLTYFKDYKTGLCFATIASKKPGQASQSGLGVSYVPCDDEVISNLIN